MAGLKRALDVKAGELSSTGMVMVHDLLVLTNDFLSDKIGPPKPKDDSESLFHKMQSQEELQKKRRVRIGALARRPVAAAVLETSLEAALLGVAIGAGILPRDDRSVAWRPGRARCIRDSATAAILRALFALGLTVGTCALSLSVPLVPAVTEARPLVVLPPRRISAVVQCWCSCVQGAWGPICD